MQDNDPHPVDNGEYVLVPLRDARALGVNAAHLLAYLTYRTRVAPEESGLRWYRRNLGQLADETGLSAHAVRQSLKALQARGLVFAEQRALRSGDRTWSYRVARETRTNTHHADSHDDHADSHDRTVDIASSQVRPHADSHDRMFDIARSSLVESNNSSPTSPQPTTTPATKLAEAESLRIRRWEDLPPAAVAHAKRLAPNVNRKAHLDMFIQRADVKTVDVWFKWLKNEHDKGRDSKFWSRIDPPPRPVTAAELGYQEVLTESDRRLEEWLRANAGNR
jgi:hypothetical protein